MTIDAGGRGGKRSKIEESILDVSLVVCALTFLELKNLSEQDDMFVRVNYDRFDIKIRNSVSTLPIFGKKDMFIDVACLDI